MKGATGITCLTPQISTHFNSRSREGSDLTFNVLSALIADFNSRSREGSDKVLCIKNMALLKFQFTLP
ncbi:hypothetical protein Epro_1079 [Endomicrobium proavitum]|uniref:Uncharacterized protein n=1 Tax=Endomicrobium proavitum TaxID=1408281 RepID=A0A0G3WJJ7_9BACT|nr:hypothetical protein Epro_1079 [Endomicrobium proavitum]